MLKLVPALALLLTAALAQTPPGSATYRNDALHFSYRYPDDLKPSTALADALARGMAGPDAPDKDAQKMLKCTSVPLSAGRGLSGANLDEFGLLLLLQFDHACIGQPGEADDLGRAAQQLMQFLKSFGKPLTEDAVDYKLDGHAASFVQGSVETRDGHMLHAASTCMLVSNRTFCFLLIDGNHKHMPAFVANPITFDGGSPTPLIPADRTQPW